MLYSITVFLAVIALFFITESFADLSSNEATEVEDDENFEMDFSTLSLDERVTELIKDIRFLYQKYGPDEFAQLKIRDIFAIADLPYPGDEASSLSEVDYNGFMSVEHHVSNEFDAHVFTEEEKFTLAGAAREVHGRILQLPPLPEHSGLNSTCSNQLCDMMTYLLSCKAQNLGFKRICARYLVGTVYHCSNYPSYPDAIYDAPSICLPQYIGFFSSLAGKNPTGVTIQSTLTTYLTKNFDVNTCGRRCYQLFQNASNGFFLNCYSELAANQKAYAAPFAMGLFQQFRNQACVKNPQNYNCYLNVTQVALSLKTTVFNPYCVYSGKPTANVLANLCSQFGKFGCCAATGFSILQYNQVGAKNGSFTILPPCLLNYFNKSCPAISMNNFCNEGSISTLTGIQFSFQISKGTNFPNVYDTKSLLNTQGIFSSILNQNGFGLQPYNFTKDYPFQVQIYGYTYYNGSIQLTPANGIPASPPGSDYSKANKGVFYVQVMSQNLNAQQAQALTTAIQTYFPMAIPKVYASTIPASLTMISPASSVYTIDPRNVSHSAASGMISVNVIGLSLLAVIVNAFLTFSF